MGAVQKIKNGYVFQRKVTIPEGLTTDEVIEILKNTEGIVVNKDIYLPDEGSLFPNTYFYIYGTNINKIIHTMELDMQKVLEDLWKNKDDIMEN